MKSLRSVKSPHLIWLLDYFLRGLPTRRKGKSKEREPVLLFSRHNFKLSKKISFFFSFWKGHFYPKLLSGVHIQLLYLLPKVFYSSFLSLLVLSLCKKGLWTFYPLHSVCPLQTVLPTCNIFQSNRTKPFLKVERNKVVKWHFW